MRYWRTPALCYTILVIVLLTLTQAQAETYQFDESTQQWIQSYPGWSREDVTFPSMPLVDVEAKDNKPEHVINHHLTYNSDVGIRFINPDGKHVENDVQYCKDMGEKWVFVPNGYTLYGHTFWWGDGFNCGTGPVIYCYHGGEIYVEGY